MQQYVATSNDTVDYTGVYTAPARAEVLPDDRSRWQRLTDPLRGGMVSGVLFCSLLAINLLQTLSLVLFPLSRRLFRRCNRWCAATWWGWCVIAGNRVLGMRLVVTGDDVPGNENVILVANHQQMTDIPAIMALARSKRRLGDLKWFVKRALMHVPGIGWGMRFLNCLFVKRSWAADRDLIRRTFSTIVNEKIPVWLVSFCEGTRFTSSKLAKSREYALGNGLEPPHHVLVPRTRGFVATIEGLGEHLDAVYDLTIGYPGEIPTLWRYICGRVPEIHLHVRRYPIAQLPDHEGQQATWLLERYHEKDRLLACFRETGSFPDSVPATET